MNNEFMKSFINTFTFMSGICFAILTFFFREPIYFGFMLLFCIIFIVDSFWHFLKKFVLKDKLKAIGGEWK